MDFVADDHMTVDSALRERVFQALITNSVTMRPMPTAWSEVVAPPSATTLIEIGRLSPIIELARVSQSFVRYGPTGICSPFAEACRCFCTDATDMTRRWASWRCRRVSADSTDRAFIRRMLAMI